MNILELLHVHKSFAGAHDVTQALYDISFTLRDGEFLSIVGPSGCGKSTILRLIAGLIVPTAGKLMLNGEPITGTNPERGMVFQRAALFPWLTVEQNLTFSARMMKRNINDKEYRDEAERLLETAGLKEFRNDFPCDAFNPAALEGMMCRFQLSVAWDGGLYDCDFNQALGLKINGAANIRDLGDEPEERGIVFGQHCYACTAGAGSSCGGTTA